MSQGLIIAFSLFDVKVIFSMSTTDWYTFICIYDVYLMSIDSFCESYDQVFVRNQRKNETIAPLSARDWPTFVYGPLSNLTFLERSMGWLSKYGHAYAVAFEVNQ